MSFLKALSGSKQKGLINSSYATANAQYDKSNELAKGELDQGYQGAKGYIDAGNEGAQAGGQMYRDTLGINGADARSAAQGVYLSDDILARTRAEDLKRSGRNYNAAGSFNSGAAALAGERVRDATYGNWQNRLQGEEARGDQYTMAGVNNENARGMNQANREMSYGSARAGSAIGQGAALAANANTGVNNLMKLGGLAVSAFTGMPTNALGGSSTTPGTQANGGWQTTTTPTPWWQSMWGK
jgi:hypothetical protein